MTAIVDPQRRIQISVCIVSRNEEDRLGACLESVGWADEVIVMDLESTDDSAALARSQGAKVVIRPHVPVVELIRNEVSALARGEWILVLDPDERVSPDLGAELRRIAPRQDVDAVVIPRMNFDLGYPPSDPANRYEGQLRMYRRAAVSWPVVPNALPSVDERRLLRLPARDELVIIHDRNRTISEIVDRIARYAPAQGQSMVDRGMEFSAQAMVRDLARRSYALFVVARPWRDGVPGFFRAGILVGFHFYVWLSFWERSGGTRTAADDRFLARFGTAVSAARTGGKAVRAPARTLRRLLPRSRAPGTQDQR